MKYEPTYAASLNADQAAFSCASEHMHQKGLTKREYFAGLAIQGILSQFTELAANGGGVSHYGGMIESIVKEAIDIADTLILELEKTKK